ncbi:RDD family protein [Caballeronia sp. LZ001]|uniref:RDD family protein n=1 Tax=Caballeronia sp. LZ001 TaxID=3038553 RepID=UPI0028608E9A|nr:RDD family protein [Caballeronia sp. LZ001]MDR5804528.1 RDD family protein [Caballeronia sp. LZ001]
MSASASTTTPLSPLHAPTLRRRLATMVYEGVILFGVVFISGYLFSTLTQQKNGLTHHNWLMTWIGLVLAAYFVWFWTHGGQTLPMKTWRLKLVDAHGEPVTPGRALARYALAWLWFLPPLALHPLLGLAVPQTLAVFAAWIALWAAAVRLDPARQFLHDRLAGTRIIMAPAPYK